MMKKIYTRIFSLIFFCCCYFPIQAQTCGVSAVYGGGPFYNNASVTIPEIRSSGFNTVIVWTIHIDAKGNLDFNAEFPIVANGKYIGTTKYANFSRNMTLLKTPPTSVTRIEFGLSASGSSTFSNIKALIASEGTGPTSMLYKNFKALKDSVPALDALNFDDESTYDVSSSVKFAVMLAGLGYKIALCPYTSSNYWTSVASQTNNQVKGAVDKIFLQCYDGGASNNPCNWNFNGIPIYPGLWDTKDTPAGVQTKLTNWKKQCGIQGGFMWLYDDFKGTAATKQYANAINTAIGIGVPGKANYTSPANGATNVSLNPLLTWDADACAQSHDLYLGTSNPPALVGNQAGTSYSASSLMANTTYYWRVDEKNFFGTTTGTVQSFTTTGPTGIASTGEGRGLLVLNSYPNPFNEQMQLEVTAPERLQLSISIVNGLGQEVYRLCQEETLLGTYTFSWSGTDHSGNAIPKGLYIVRVQYVNGEHELKTTSLKVQHQ